MNMDYTPDQLELLLRDTPYEITAACVETISRNGYTYRDLYKIGTNDTGFFAAKIRSAESTNVENSLICLDEMKDTEGLFQPYLLTIKKNGVYVLVSDWIEGKQPHEGYRKAVPEFFRKLARFNLNNQITGQYTSMYADGRYSDTIEELVDTEIDYHLQYFGFHEYKNAALEAVQPLKHGLASIVFSDTNLGNMFILDDGITFIDTEWLHRGLNLHQFEHLNYFSFNEPQWYNITDEAGECYSAYFSELPISIDDANSQIRAIEVLRVFRASTYWRFHKKEDMYPQTVVRLRKILAHPRYV